VDLGLVGAAFLLGSRKPAEDMLDAVPAVRELFSIIWPCTETVERHAHFDDDFGHRFSPVACFAPEDDAHGTNDTSPNIPGLSHSDGRQASETAESLSVGRQTCGTGIATS